MSAVLDPKTADRLAKVCGMFGSSHDGERAAAAALADKLIRELGVTWSEIVGAIAQSPDGERGEWIEIIEACLSNPDVFASEREAAFVASMRRLVIGGHPPSERQAEWLRSIRERIE